MSSELRQYAPPARPSPPDDPRVTAARKEAEARQAMYIHLTVFTLVNLALFLINAVTHSQGGGWWFYWPLLWWGAALLIHVATVKLKFFSDDWKERETKRILERDQRKAA